MLYNIYSEVSDMKYYLITSAVKSGSNITKAVSSRNFALNYIAEHLGINVEVEDIYFRDEPHKHEQVLKCNDGSLFFVDRILA